MLLPSLLLAPRLQQGYVPTLRGAAPVGSPDSASPVGKPSPVRSSRWTAPFRLVLMSGCDQCSVAIGRDMKLLEDTGPHDRTVVALVDPQPELLEAARRRYPWAEVFVVEAKAVAPLNPWFAPRAYRIDDRGKIAFAEERRAEDAGELKEAIDGRD